MTPPFPCLWCEETVEPGDLRHSLLPGYHFACAQRQLYGSIGHLKRMCSCHVPGGGEHDPPELTKRQAARLVADFLP